LPIKTSFQKLAPIQISSGKKIYFAGDFHLGIPDKTSSLLREKLICQWLRSIAPTAEHIFLMGDMFDAWIEYKKAVPKGFTRLLGCLAELRDSGVSISAFSGNHDLWMYGYFEEELQIPVYHQPIEIMLHDKIFFIGHGDGLGPDEKKYKMLKSFLRNPLCQWLYSQLHPNIGLRLAQYFSERGLHKKSEEEKQLPDEQDYLIQFCKMHIYNVPTINYFIFGHRHLMMEKKIAANCTYFNTGDWIRYNSFVEFDGESCTLKQYL
jgi:UDP-2,3-diacylglucosamine hydrolase